MVQITTRSTKPALLDIKFLSHGTLECVDMQASRRFYEEVFGFDIVQHNTVSMFIRLGSDHVYAVVETGRVHEMPLLNHNGLDLGSIDEVNDAYQSIKAVQEEYLIKKLTEPQFQHGSYGFFLCDLDGNWWELLANPPGGYSYHYDDPARDLTGRTDFSEAALRSYVPPMPNL